MEAANLLFERPTSGGLKDQAGLHYFQEFEGGSRVPARPSPCRINQTSGTMSGLLYRHQGPSYIQLALVSLPKVSTPDACGLLAIILL